MQFFHLTAFLIQKYPEQLNNFFLVGFVFVCLKSARKSLFYKLPIMFLH